MVSERASRDWLCKAERRAIWTQGRSSPWGEGMLLVGVCFTCFIFAIKGISPLDPYGHISHSNMKANKKQITLMSHKVVLKHKSVCLAKSYLSFVASLDPKLPDCGMTRQGVLGGKGSGAYVINCSSTSLLPWRILQETTGPTGWQWLSWSLLSSPSCLCSSKVILRECTDHASDESMGKEMNKSLIRWIFGEEWSHPSTFCISSQSWFFWKGWEDDWRIRNPQFGSLDSKTEG